MNAREITDNQKANANAASGAAATESASASAGAFAYSPQAHVSPFALRLAKYTAVGRITVRNNLAYFYDFLIRSFFLIVILYVFIQLWQVTYEGVGETLIAGYTYEQIIWYLIFAEAIILATPRLTVKVEEEVKRGDIGYQLTRPMSYILFHYASFMGEAAVRFVVNLLVGGALGLFMFGLPDFGWGWIGFLLVAVGSFTVNFVLLMMIALCSFWVEDTRGIDFVYNKLLFTVGGMMLPLETFPDTLHAVCQWLPFQTVVYFASKIATQFDAALLGRMILIQWTWVALLSLGLAAIYRKGVKKLNVNGG